MFSADHVVFTHAVGRSATAVLPKASSDLSAGGALDLIELTIVEARRTHTHGKHFLCWGCVERGFIECVAIVWLLCRGLEGVVAFLK